MPQASYILTYRQGEGSARRDNFFAVLAWLARYPQIEVILVEQDIAPTLQLPLPNAQCRLVFAYNPGPFNKGWGYNVGVRHSRQGAYVFGDADMIVGDALIEGLKHLAQGLHVVKPYRRLIDLDANQTARIRSGDFDWLPPATSGATNREGIGEYIVFAGGVFLMAQAAFAHVGGWDERFVGWGGEDDAMTYKIERSRMPGIELDLRPAIHLHHERSIQTTSGQPHYATNCALLEDYRRLADGELARFAEIQRQIIGHREKYRPT